MTVTSSPVRPRYHHMGEPITSPAVIDFFRERDRLFTEPDEFNRHFETERVVRKVAARRSHPTALSDRFEDWLYSLISGAALVSILWGIFCLADFTKSQTRPAGANQSGMVGHLDSSGKNLAAQPRRATLLPNKSQPSNNVQPISMRQ